MSKRKALHSPVLKAEAALAALKGDRTISQIAAAFQVHPNQICKWRRRLGAGIVGNAVQDWLDAEQELRHVQQLLGHTQPHPPGAPH
jgi:transposase-like protein